MSLVRDSAYFNQFLMGRSHSSKLKGNTEL